VVQNQDVFKREGWTYIGSSPRQCYIRNGRSLCGRDALTDRFYKPIVCCKKCLSKLKEEEKAALVRHINNVTNGGREGGDV